MKHMMFALTVVIVKRNMKYKTKLRIPTDAYAYIEVEVEDEPSAIVSAYHEFTKLVKPQVGLPQKDFNKALDRYLTENTGDTDTYLAMSRSQQDVFQEVKKAFKRINKE